jgi:aldehyde dehydrogenase (NAD+)
VAVRVKAGQCLIKVWNTVSLQTPFGVHKNNEYGRKKGIEAIHHYSHFGMTTVRMQRVELLLNIDIVAGY